MSFSERCSFKLCNELFVKLIKKVNRVNQFPCIVREVRATLKICKTMVEGMSVTLSNPCPVHENS